MNQSTHIWSLVLAAGDGSRLHSLTTTSAGVTIPKQFCSLQGGPSLLQDAMHRAAEIAPLARQCAIVARQHRLWWETPLACLEPQNVIVQPVNRGTGHGILLSLTHILARDPDATVVVLPADHYCSDEATLAQSLRIAVRLAEANPDTVYLLGAEPDEPDTGLGYILPAVGDRAGAKQVSYFIEKPDAGLARTLSDQGALWNMFIIGSSVRALIALYYRSFVATVAEMRVATQHHPNSIGRSRAIEDLYQRLRSLDFSRQVLPGQESVLRVIPVPHCGWTDLGTPERVASILQELPRHRATSHTRPDSGWHLNLAAQQLRLQMR